MIAKTQRLRAVVIGGTGYGGGELIRRLLQHPGIELVRVLSIDHVGSPISKAHPNLEGLSTLRFEDLPVEDAARDADLVFLGLPHTVTAEKVARIMASSPARIIDLSGDFRLRDVAQYEKYYGAKHPCPELLSRFTYGAPELDRAAVARAQYIASPGCFATTIQLGLLPLARQGWLSGEVEVVAMTGSSGSGVKPQDTTHHPVRSVNIKTYKTLTHQHTPEIIQTLEHAGATTLQLHLVPVSAPLSRGLFATCFVHIDAAIAERDVAQAYQTTYQNARFVRIPQQRLPEVAAVAGSNYAEVGFVWGPVHQGKRTVTCFSALDNLIKGGAGQAIQSMNLMCGFDEGLTLSDPGGYP